MAARDALNDCVGFGWDRSNEQKNRERHQVTPEEAEDLFFQDPLVVGGDPRHSPSEKRYFALGHTSSGRRLFVVFTIRRRLIRVISVRDMNRNEAEMYERHEEKENT
jgi:uncharacterized protein